MRVLPTVLVVAFLVPALAPLAAASWGAPGDAALEPNTMDDAAGGFMFNAPTTGGPDRVYFNAFLGSAPTPPVLAGALSLLTETQAIAHAQASGMPQAFFGVWRDCNEDGYIGDGVTAEPAYPSQILLTPFVCPAGSPYNDGANVHEFRWIGPGSSDINAPEALVWMDLGRPSSPLTGAPRDRPTAQLQYDDAAAGARWSSSGIVTAPSAVPVLASQTLPPAWTTAYAYADPWGAIVSIAQLPRGGSLSMYGMESCDGATTGTANGWDCAPDEWPGEVKLYAAYDLRDVDCFDSPTEACDRPS